MTESHRIRVADLATFDDAFGAVGLRVGPRTGPDRRTQDDKEWWVLRRFLKVALRANLFVTPLLVWKEQPPMPDFAIEFGDAGTALIEITEATHPDDQREMTRFEGSGQSARLLGDFGGRFSGGAGEPGHAWSSDIIDAIERKAGKSIYATAAASNRHLVIYPNSNASLLVFAERDERRVFSILAKAIEPRRAELASIANGCAVHVVETHLARLDVLGKNRLVRVRMNDLQARALQLLSDFAERFSCVKAVHLFGSVARGATDEAQDIDIFFEFADDMRFSSDQVAMFTAFQDELELWRQSATEALGKPVTPCCTYYGSPDVDIWNAIRATPPDASLGKAFMVPTPAVLKR